MRERLVLFSWQRHLQIPIFRFTLADLFLTACQDPHGTPWDPGAHSFCLGAIWSSCASHLELQSAETPRAPWEQQMSAPLIAITGLENLV